jgi:hypothetical protein
MLVEPTGQHREDALEVMYGHRQIVGEVEF